jgi:hypothetical protein|tara:strand:- start:93 stop:551 length:459 start_codon:yes stop_codon:yes gene_type:complete
MESVTELLQMDFDMPEVDEGTPVSYYPNGKRDTSFPRLGFVVRISRSGRNLMLRTSDGQIFDAVRHLSDPKLRINVEHRENGAWDYTDHYKKELSERENMKNRLARLEDILDDKKGLGSYRALRDKAIELGIEFKGNPKRGWLEEAIQSKES